MKVHSIEHIELFRFNILRVLYISISFALKKQGNFSSESVFHCSLINLAKGNRRGTNREAEPMISNHRLMAPDWRALLFFNPL